MNIFLNDAFPWIIAAILLAAQLSMIIPILPALWIEWAAILVYGLVTGFDTAGWIIFIIITILTVIGGLMDNIMMGANAKVSGASWLSVGASVVGAIAGSLLWPPFGGLILAMAAIFLVEFLRIKDWRKALDSTKNVAVGCGWGVVLRFIFGLLIIAAWLLWVLVF
jgi:uncharacterized protein YqgC (DUF456 family)